MPGAGRIVIPRCIGCGAMYEPERCEHGCREQRLELVAAADLDGLEEFERAARERIGALLPVLYELAERVPEDGDWRRAYLALAGAARRALHDAVPPATRPAEDPLRISVWRCPECGAVDAPQECLGICIWRRFEWVPAGDYETRLAHAAATGELERRLSGLLRRVAFATPRAEAWQRSWDALSQEAQVLIVSCAQTSEQLEAYV